MLVTLLGFIVGGHSFTVPTASTPVASLDVVLDLSGRSGVAAVYDVTQSVAGGVLTMQCCPTTADCSAAGSGWVAAWSPGTVSLASVASSGATLNGDGTLDWRTLAVSCRTTAHLRGVLSGGANGTAKMTYLGLQFQ